MPAAKAACVGFRNQLWIAYGLMFFGAAIYWFLLCASLGPLLVYCPKFGGRLRGKFGKLAGSCEVRVRRSLQAIFQAAPARSRCCGIQKNYQRRPAFSLHRVAEYAFRQRAGGA